MSRSGEVDTSWQGSVLLRDIADVKRLKQEDGPNLVTQGSTELVHALLANDLVDAMSIFTVPVVLGGGKKLFADGSAPHSFKLTRSRVSTNGLIVGHYLVAGRARGFLLSEGQFTAIDFPKAISTIPPAENSRSTRGSLHRTAIGRSYTPSRPASDLWTPRSWLSQNGTSNVPKNYRKATTPWIA